MINNLINVVREGLSQIADHRKGNAAYDLVDHLSVTCGKELDKSSSCSQQPQWRPFTALSLLENRRIILFWSDLVIVNF